MKLRMEQEVVEQRGGSVVESELQTLKKKKGKKKAES